MRRLGERETIRSSDMKLRLKLVTGRVLTWPYVVCARSKLNIRASVRQLTCTVNEAGPVHGA
jgi:hypothetical protein